MKLFASSAQPWQPLLPMLIAILSNSKQINAASNKCDRHSFLSTRARQGSLTVGVNNSECRLFHELSVDGVTAVLHLSAIESNKKNIERFDTKMSCIATHVNYVNLHWNERGTWWNSLL